MSGKRRFLAPGEPFLIGGQSVAPGSVASFEIPLPRLYTQSELAMPVRVVAGRVPGPRLLVCAAIHGDELNGIEIIQRVLGVRGLRRLNGVLIAVPVVNVYGLINGSRYLPDRRDLNRSFPGSTKGSLTARLARLVLEELGYRATHVIDLHTGSAHRPNLPQVRVRLGHAPSAGMAHAFGAPVILDTGLREGSFRKALVERDIPSIVYETGEALCMDENGIRTGVRGVIAVMRALSMLPRRVDGVASRDPFLAIDSKWVRAPMSGVFRSSCRLGEAVSRNQLLGTVTDPLGDENVEVHASSDGVVIGKLNQALVYQGDALLHVARFKGPRRVASRLRDDRAQLERDAGFG
jgi:predicted deacylase